jgi:hypothetical protein
LLSSAFSVSYGQYLHALKVYRDEELLSRYYFSFHCHSDGFWAGLLSVNSPNGIDVWAVGLTVALKSYFDFLLFVYQSNNACEASSSRHSWKGDEFKDYWGGAASWCRAPLWFQCPLSHRHGWSYQETRRKPVSRNDRLFLS